MKRMLMLLVALAVVTLIRVAGVILVIALLTIPAAIARHWSNSLARMMGLASIIGAVFGVILGLYTSNGEVPGLSDDTAAAVAEQEGHDVVAVVADREGYIQQRYNGGVEKADLGGYGGRADVDTVHIAAARRDIREVTRHGDVAVFAQRVVEPHLERGRRRAHVDDLKCVVIRDVGEIPLDRERAGVGRRQIDET